MAIQKQQEKPPTKKAKRIHLAILKQMITLSTAGFGVVAALAWNSVITELVDKHIRPYLPQGSGLVSLLLYAVLITSIAVIVTSQLTRIIEKLEV